MFVEPHNTRCDMDHRHLLQVEGSVRARIRSLLESHPLLTTWPALMKAQREALPSPMIFELQAFEVDDFRSFFRGKEAMELGFEDGKWIRKTSFRALKGL